MTVITEQSMRRQPRRDVRVYHAFHLAVAHKLQVTDRSQWLPVVESNIAKRRSASRGRLADERMQEWDRLVHGPLDDLIEACLQEGEWGEGMRQTSPFAGVLSAEERNAAMSKALTTITV